MRHCTIHPFFIQKNYSNRIYLHYLQYPSSIQFPFVFSLCSSQRALQAETCNEAHSPKPGEDILSQAVYTVNHGLCEKEHRLYKK